MELRPREGGWAMVPLTIHKSFYLDRQRPPPGFDRQPVGGAERDTWGGGVTFSCPVEKKGAKSAIA